MALGRAVVIASADEKELDRFAAFVVLVRVRLRGTHSRFLVLHRRQGCFCSHLTLASKQLAQAFVVTKRLAVASPLLLPLVDVEDVSICDSSPLRLWW